MNLLVGLYHFTEQKMNLLREIVQFTRQLHLIRFIKKEIDRVDITSKDRSLFVDCYSCLDTFRRRCADFTTVFLPSIQTALLFYENGDIGKAFHILERDHSQISFKSLYEHFSMILRACYNLISSSLEIRKCNEMLLSCEKITALDQFLKNSNIITINIACEFFQIKDVCIRTYGNSPWSYLCWAIHRLIGIRFSESPIVSMSFDTLRTLDTAIGFLDFFQDEEIEFLSCLKVDVEFIEHLKQIQPLFLISEIHVFSRAENGRKRALSNRQEQVLNKCFFF